MNVAPKTAAAGLGGSLAIIVVWILQLCNLTVPPEVAAALATILGAVASYFAPRQQQPIEEPKP